MVEMKDTEVLLSHLNQWFLVRGPGTWEREEVGRLSCFGAFETADAQIRLACSS